MSLRQGIKHNKEHRKEYRGAKAFDPTTRNHGSDSWARENRLHKMKNKEPIIEKNVDKEE